MIADFLNDAENKLKPYYYIELQKNVYMVLRYLQFYSSKEGMITDF